MAASITGVFTIIDRASGPMRKMESQALKTMAAIEAVGASQDKSSKSTNAAGRRMDEATRSMKNVESASRSGRRELDNLEKSARNNSRSFDQLADRLGRVNQVFRFFGTILSALKLPVMAIGIVGLAQAIGQLAGAVAALIPGLVQASGALAALPQTVSAGVQGFLTFKLALGGVSDALKSGMQMQQQHTQVVQDSATAHINAVHGVQEAEYSLGQTQRGVQQAQMALTQARRDAVRNLTDLKYAAMGADLAQARAGLSLREARQQLAQAAVNPGTTDLQMQDLQLSVKEAQLNVRQSRTTRGRSRADLSRGKAQGVNRNQNVVASQNALTDAIHSQTDAAFALTSAQRELRQEEQRGTGVAATFKQAMANLSPPAQTFVKHLMRMQPELKKLRATAAGGLFPGLGRGLTSLNRAFPMVNRVTRRSSRALGNESARAAARFTTPGALSDIEGLGNENVTIMTRMVRGVSNLGDALLNVMVAAKPFTDWLTHEIYMATVWIDNWAKAGRESGRFADKLVGTRERLKQFGDILLNLYHLFHNVSAAATPLGNRLWDGVDQATKSWAAFTTQGTTGFDHMQKWFNKLYDPLHALGQLTKDLLGAWARITVNPSFTRSIDALDKAVPTVEKLFNAGSNLGPATVSALSDIARLFSDLPFSALSMFVSALDAMFKALDFIVEKVPAAKYALTGLLLAGTIGRSIKLMETLLLRWKEYIGIASFGKLGGGGGGGAGGILGGLGRRGVVTEAEQVATRGGGLGVGKVLAGDALGMAALGGGVAKGAEGASLLARLGGMGGLAKLGLGAAGKFAAPLAALQFGLGAATFKGNFGQRMQAGLSSTTFGLIHGPVTDATKRAQADARVNQYTGRLTQGQDPAAAQARIGALQREIGRVHQDAMKQPTVSSGRYGVRRPAGAAIFAPSAKETQLLKDYNAQLQREKANLSGLLDQQSVMRAQKFGGELGSVFDVYKKGLGSASKASEKTTHDVTSRLQGMRLSGARVLGQAGLDWAREFAKAHPKLKSQVGAISRSIENRFAAMGQNVQIVNGQILTGSKSEWSQIGQALQDPIEQAREAVTKGFTAMQKQAIGSLMAMGFSRSEAKGLISGANRAGGDRILTNATTQGAATIHAKQRQGAAKQAHGARGMRIPGVGTQDTVPLTLGMAAPGELIVNRHTEARQNAINRTIGAPPLGSLVAGEKRPHSATARYGIMPGFAKGGVVGSLPAMMAAANAINSKHWSYLWGGGHDANFTPPYDCSGAVSSVLHAGGVLASPHTSGDLANMYLPGPGDVTIYANPEHTYMSLMGKFFGTSTANPGGGAGWFAGAARPGFTQRHVNVRGGTGKFTGSLPANLSGAALTAALINAPSLTGGGGAGAAGNAAMAGFAMGLNQTVQNAAGGGGTAAGGNLDAWLTTALRMTHHYSPTNLSLLRGRAMQESGGNPAAINNWDSNARAGHPSQGLLQTIPSTFASYKLPGLSGGILDPVANASAAIRYMYARYHHIVGPGPGGYAYGGRTPQWGGWHAKGGSFTVDRPTIFGAGEAGSETVNISSNRAGGGKRPIHVNIEHVSYARKGDLKKAVQEEIEALADDLDLVGVEPD